MSDVTEQDFLDQRQSVINELAAWLEMAETLGKNPQLVAAEFMAAFGEAMQGRERA